MYRTLQSFSSRTAKNQYRKFEINIPRKEIARPQSQFPHSCVSVRDLYIPTVDLAVLLQEIFALHIIRFMWGSARFGTFTVVSVNGSLAEDKMCRSMGQCAHFSFKKCPICTHDGACPKFSANSHETNYIVDRSWEYLNRSQTHECDNWDWGRAIPRIGIYKWDFRCSAHQPDESASPGRVLDEGAEALGSLVPAADGQHCLQLLVVRLQRCKPPIAA